MKTITEKLASQLNSREKANRGGRYINRAAAVGK